MTTSVNKINGLILSGGESSRLGYPKEKIKWHGLPQWDYLNRMLSPIVDKVYLSDNNIWQSKIPTIIDQLPGKGPIGGILSALKHDEDAAWLIVACDLPLLSAGTITQLVNAYITSPALTCYYNIHQNRPEPVVSIWSPDLLKSIEPSVRSEQYSLQPYMKNANLINSSCEEFVNVNTPLEYYKVKSQLPYIPIDCNYYDHIEASALNSSALIEYYDGNGMVSFEDKIVTTEITDHTEYLITASHGKIRMDMIHAINLVPNPIQ